MIINLFQVTSTLGDRVYSAAALDKYVYVFLTSCATYRIEYGRMNATWEKMADCQGKHGPVVLLKGNDSKLRCFSSVKFEASDVFTRTYIHD